MSEYALEKSVWTEADFEKMGWHDATIRAISFTNEPETFLQEFILDIDYIFQWVHPKWPKKEFSFFVSPCTLVFHDVQDLRMQIETGGQGLEIEIQDIHRTLVGTNRAGGWRVELQLGEITFEASGFTQFVRKSPVHLHGQVLSMTEREGISFEREPTNP